MVMGVMPAGLMPRSQRVRIRHRRDGDVDALRTRPAQQTAANLQRGAGGEHVIDQDYFLPLQVGPPSKHEGVLHVRRPL